jgi:hypothetical protein
MPQAMQNKSIQRAVKSITLFAFTIWPPLSHAAELKR